MGNNILAGGRYLYLRVWTRFRVPVKLRVKFRIVNFYCFLAFFSFCNAFSWGFFAGIDARCPNSAGPAREQESVVLFTRIALQNTRAIDMNLH